MKLRTLFVASALVLALSACKPPEKTDKSDGDRPSRSASDSKGSSNTGDDAARLEKANALSAAASQGHVKVLSFFDGPTDNIVGMVVQADGRPKEIAYANEDLTILFPQAFGTDGRTLNEKALQEQSVILSPEKFADRLVEEDVGFIVGKSGPVVTVFLDPNCGYCSRFYSEVMPLVNKGELRLRAVMVGILSQNSLERSAVILADSNPAKALDWDEKNKEAAGKKSEGASEKHAEAFAKVQAYTALFGEAGAPSTPTILACREGQDISIERGQPQDLKGFVASLDKEGSHEICR